MLTLAAGEEQPITIRCTFEPQRLVVDPDVRVLMLKRQKAEVRLRPARAARAASAARSGSRAG